MRALRVLTAFVFMALVARESLATRCGNFGEQLKAIRLANPKRGLLASKASRRIDPLAKARGLGGTHDIHGIDELMTELAAKADDLDDGRGPLFELVDGARYPDIAGYRRPFRTSNGDLVTVDEVLGNMTDPTNNPTKLIDNYGSRSPSNELEKIREDIRALADLLNQGIAPEGEIHLYGTLADPQHLQELEALARAQAAPGRPVVTILQNLQSVVGNLD